MNKNFNLPKEILGENLSLRCHSVSLAQTMFDYIDKDRERLRKFLPWVDHISCVEHEKEHIERCLENWENKTSFAYGLYNREDIYMGNISIFDFGKSGFYKCEIGYWILGDFEGHGYMSKAIKLLEEVLFIRGMHRIQIRCSTENLRSANIPKANSYKLDGTQRETIYANEKFHDLLIFSKLSTD